MYDDDKSCCHCVLARSALAKADDLELTKGGTAVATYAPPKPTLTSEPQLPNQDVYEVRIYDSRRNRHLVAAIEIASPSNKDRPENRATTATSGPTATAPRAPSFAG